MLEDYMKEQKLDYDVTAMFGIKKAHSEITKDGLVSEDDSIRIISLIVSAVRSNDEFLAMLRKAELAFEPPPSISKATRLCDIADILMGKKL